MRTNYIKGNQSFNKEYHQFRINKFISKSIGDDGEEEKNVEINREVLVVTRAQEEKEPMDVEKEAVLENMENIELHELESLNPWKKKGLREIEQEDQEQDSEQTLWIESEELCMENSGSHYMTIEEIVNTSSRDVHKMGPFDLMARLSRI